MRETSFFPVRPLSISAVLMRSNLSGGVPNVSNAQRYFSGRWVIMGETTTYRLRISSLRDSSEERSSAHSVKSTKHRHRRRSSLSATRVFPEWARLVRACGAQLRSATSDRRNIRAACDGFHDLMNGVGAHEIIAETPRHDSVACTNLKFTKSLT